MRSRLRVFLVALAVLTVVAAVFAPLWLKALGHALVRSATPEPADAALVLAGDWQGARILEGCRLAREGLVPMVLVSGPMDWYGINEADGAIRFAVEKGCDRSMFVPVYTDALSTREEARKVKPEIVRRRIQSLLLVTSSYHTARAFRIFRKEFDSGIRITPVAAADRFFAPENWWQTREGQKVFYFEASKTAADWIGL